jgi:vanillate O-demethylase ferredoxin subunit
MALALARAGKQLELHYATAAEDRLAFADELANALGDQLHTYTGDSGKRLDLAALFATAPDGTEVYFCGPIRMLDAARHAWREAGRDLAGFRFEMFGDSGLFPAQSFTAHLPAHNLSIEVPAGTTLLDAMIEAGIDMVYDCKRGECGLCAVGVTDASGRIDHRDVFLSDAEKAAGDRMCTCVSRAAGGSITIDTGYRPAAKPARQAAVEA